MLTRNVTKEHVHEIFSYFGTIRNIVMPTQGNVNHHLLITYTPVYFKVKQAINKYYEDFICIDGRSWLSKGMAYVEYESYDHVAEAVKMMDGGKFPPQ